MAGGAEAKAEIRGQFAYMRFLMARLVGDLMASLILNKSILDAMWEDLRCREAQSDACDGIRDLKEWVSSRLSDVEDYVREISEMGEAE